MNFKKLALSIAALTVALSLAACTSTGGTKSSSSNNSDELQTSVSKDTTIIFWHAMTGAQQAQLEKMTAAFEKANPKIHVTLQNQSSYADLQAKLTSTMQSPKDLPTITQAYPGWLYNASQNDMLVDQGPFLKNSKIGITGDDAIQPALLEGAKFGDMQAGIPFNKSTEALFYNADMLKQYDVKVPTTMDELKEAAKTIYEKSNHEVVGAGFDALNNYYAIGMRDEGSKFDSKTDFTSKASKNVVSYYVDGVKDGYFRTAGSDKYLSGPFANQKVAMFIGTIAGESFVAQDAKFEYGVSPRPSKFNIQQGTDIYMFANADKNQQTAAYLYEKFLVSTKEQVEWAIASGYMPVTTAGLKDKGYTDSKKSKVPAILAATSKKLFTNPIEKNSDAAYTQLTATMQEILSSPNGNIDDMLKKGQTELEGAWKQ
ncbi:MAG: extracellular solute-binding protein [Streptococcaceae bacterium]|jgi:multiple sugar transport system substrate-binding protein|nr:extracellular solute-binding protein [Streptococcaceae bacterium]